MGSDPGKVCCANFSNSLWLKAGLLAKISNAVAQKTGRGFCFPEAMRQA
jgi:hypothetical protein